jgi:putative transposase
MQKWQQWESASDADWGLAVEREAVIRPLAEHKRFCTDDMEEAASHLGVVRSVLYKLVRRYRQRPQTSSLLPFKRGRDTYTTVLDKTREHLLDSCIREFYLRPERPSFASLIQEVRRQFVEQQLPHNRFRSVMVCP